MSARWEKRKAEFNRATAFLKKKCILVDVVNRAEPIRKYRVSGKRELMLLEQVIAHAVLKGMNEHHG